MNLLWHNILCNKLSLHFKLTMKNFLFLAVVFLTGQTLKSQCLTDHISDNHDKEHGILDSFYYQMESAVTEYKNSQGTNVRRAKFIVPVVFHIIHNGGAENISKEQILDQLRVVNEDFSNTNADKSMLRTYFKNLNIAADLDIEFRMAKIDNNGNCTDGVNRVYSGLTYEAGEEVKSLPGVQWSYTKYLNIYIVSSIENDDPSSTGIILGYARFPWQTSAGTDGILLRADRTGTIGTAVAEGGGRTLTHEIGHWLGLKHPFQGGCTTSSTWSDGVDDTPPVALPFSNANCPATGNSCNNDSLDLWENYMDYSRGVCQVMFTKGQKTRTDFYLTTTSSSQSVRRFNVSQSNLIATGVLSANEKPVASFSSSARVICVGSPVSYSDESCKGQVDTRQWIFDGANTTSTNAEKPVVVYNTPGMYKVQLTVTNTNGSATEVQDKYIEVLPAESSYNRNVREDFQVDIDKLNAFQAVKLAPSNGSFEISKTTGHKSSQSLFAPISAATPIGTSFILESQAISAKYLRGLPRYFTFMTAYAPDPNGAIEELRVYVSTDCGSNFKQVFYRSNTTLGRVTATISSYIPGSDDEWRLQFVNLGAHINENDSNFKIRFAVTSNGGNSVYIDNINFSQFLSSTETILPSEVDMYPNPATNKLTVNAPKGINKIEIVNLLGQTVYSQVVISSNTALIEEQIPLYNLENGVYMVRFVSDNNTFAKKLVINR
jgi:PKD repeat protein